jgi:hypothetical protein
MMSADISVSGLKKMNRKISDFRIEIEGKARTEEMKAT